jgi:hypothetical protein
MRWRVSVQVSVIPRAREVRFVRLIHTDDRLAKRFDITTRGKEAA